jgi:hypothetical protein
MTVVIGLLLYALCIAWLCALTGANRLDGPEPASRPRASAAPAEPAPAAGAVSASEAHG